MKLAVCNLLATATWLLLMLLSAITLASKIATTTTTTTSTSTSRTKTKTLEAQVNVMQAANRFASPQVWENSRSSPIKSQEKQNNSNSGADRWTPSPLVSDGDSINLRRWPVSGSGSVTKTISVRQQQKRNDDLTRRRIPRDATKLTAATDSLPAADITHINRNVDAGKLAAPHLQEGNKLPLAQSQSALLTGRWSKRDARLPTIETTIESPAGKLEAMSQVAGLFEQVDDVHLARVAEASVGIAESRGTHESERKKRAAGATYRAQQRPPVSRTPREAMGGALAKRRAAAAATDYVDRLYIDTETMQLEAQAHLGSTAYLLCRLRSSYHQTQATSGGQNLANQVAELQVSWVRNMQILTTGESRYTSDERFRSSHVAGSSDWILEIHNVKSDDEGDYECQVNSEPKPATVTISLSIVTANLFIMESPQLLVDEYESIQLTCRVEFSSTARELEWRESQQQQPIKILPPLVTKHEFSQRPKELRQPQVAPATKLRPASVTKLNQYYLYWYKDNRSLEYNNPRGNILVERHELPPSTLESSLRLDEATESDSGLYLCKLVPELAEVRPAQTRVVVGGASAASSAAAAAASSAAASFLLAAAMSHQLISLLLLSLSQIFLTQPI